MFNKRNVAPIVAALGTTFAVALTAVPVTSAAQNPFSLTEFSSGYLLAEHDEGKCGEGKCGGDPGEDPADEGKCGEGKCGS